MKKKLRYIALAFFIVLFLVSGFMLIRDLVTSKKEKDANEKLAEQVRAARELRQASVDAPLTPAPTPAEEGDKPEGMREPEGSQASEEAKATQAASATQGVKATLAPTPTPGPTPTPLPKYAESGNLYIYDLLWQQNKDLAGWIFAESIGVDYPVMYTPDNLEYYIHKGFDKAYAKSGCLFIGSDWSLDSDYTIIYGHHMKNGTMFGKLDSYASEAYAREHPAIYFDTLKEEGNYEVVTAFYTRVYNKQDEGVFRYYQYTDLPDQETFDEYFAEVRKIAIYDTGIDVQYGDKILVLSTCSYHTENGRFVVVARCRQEEEEEDMAKAAQKAVAD